MMTDVMVGVLKRETKRECVQEQTIKEGAEESSPLSAFAGVQRK
jgi:hypothetical protein